MAGFSAISDVSESLRQALQDEMDLVFPAANRVTVTLDSPRKIQEDQHTDDRIVSLFLFKVAEKPEMRNLPPYSGKSGEIRPTPLALDLQYMLTPYGSNHDARLRFLGKAMQVLNGSAVLSGSKLRSRLEGSGESFRISGLPMGQDAISQVWQALEVSLRLSVFYLVTPLLIEGDPQADGERVGRREFAPEEP